MASGDLEADEMYLGLVGARIPSTQDALLNVTRDNNNLRRNLSRLQVQFTNTVSCLKMKVKFLQQSLSEQTQETEVVSQMKIENTSLRLQLTQTEQDFYDQQIELKRSQEEIAGLEEEIEALSNQLDYLKGMISKTPLESQKHDLMDTRNQLLNLKESLNELADLVVVNKSLSDNLTGTMSFLKKLEDKTESLQTIVKEGNEKLEKERRRAEDERRLNAEYRHKSERKQRKTDEKLDNVTKMLEKMHNLMANRNLTSSLARPADVKKTNKTFWMPNAKKPGFPSVNKN
ncbi:tropomyosin-like [Mya arenaria]|uniref:tropomyosin-like n=1 Tax=Mya arenaria TaxID=6604 RepID=UPI0022E80BD6|nr:tropomyosin-like [Mya arenaria]